VATAQEEVAYVTGRLHESIAVRDKLKRNQAVLHDSLRVGGWVRPQHTRSPVGGWAQRV
jgi:hypothetical protein